VAAQAAQWGRARRPLPPPRAPPLAATPVRRPRERRSRSLRSSTRSTRTTAPRHCPNPRLRRGLCPGAPSPTPPSLASSVGLPCGPPPVYTLSHRLTCALHKASAASHHCHTASTLPQPATPSANRRLTDAWRRVDFSSGKKHACVSESARYEEALGCLHRGGFGGRRCKEADQSHSRAPRVPFQDSAAGTARTVSGKHGTVALPPPASPHLAPKSSVRLRRCVSHRLGALRRVRNATARRRWRCWGAHKAVRAMVDPIVIAHDRHRHCHRD